MNRNKPILVPAALILLLAFSGCAPQQEVEKGEMSPVMSVRDQSATVNRITQMRLDKLLPRFMRETNFNMWIIICDEDNYDPVFNSMIPYNTWCPITQILVLYDRGPEEGVERLNLSRSNLQGLHEDAWDHRAWDLEQKESQWDAFTRVVKERDPQRIAINQAGTIWAADGLSARLKEDLMKAIGPEYSRRLHSSEKLATLWFETLLDEELELYEGVVGIAHDIIKRTLSSEVITPNETTLDDLLWGHVQIISDMGLDRYGWPWFRIRWRDPEVLEKYGMEDRTLRPGDLIQCDAGIRYLRYYTDHSEWGYIPRPGETEVPPELNEVLAEGHRLQDIFCEEFQLGLTGNQILNNILSSAKEKGIGEPKIYSHAIGYFLHEPGPLIGLPWEQEDTGERGEVELVYNSTFTAELSVALPVRGFGGKKLRMAIEEMVAFTEKGAYFLDGRQEEVYIIN